MKIAVSADHRGVSIYTLVRDLVTSCGHQLVEVPTCQANSCDYPDMAWAVASAVAGGQADRGILMCGSGIGMSISANKVKGVRAALCHDDVTAEMARRHNDANVLCLPADLLGRRLIENIVHIWLDTEFEGGRHARRVAKITAIESGQNPAESTDQ